MSLFDRWRAKVVYSANGMRASAAGLQYRNTVQIRPEHAGDVGLLAHELTHVKQWQLCIVVGAAVEAAFGALLGWPFAVLFGLMGVYQCEALHGFLYSRCVNYRLWAEAWAYRVQLKHYPERTDSIAEWMASEVSGYQFGITKEQALKELEP